MKVTTKRAAALILSIVMIISVFSIGASAAEPKSIVFPSGSSDVSIYMNGERVLEGRSRLINSVTYVALRDFCALVGDCEVTWDAKTRTAVATKGTKVATATDMDYYIYADGRCFYTDVSCRMIGGTLYVPIRAAARAFDARVIWNDSSRSVDIVDNGGVCAAADEIYWDGSVLWLSRIIYAESRGEPLLGKIAVGNVVMNRVDSNLFPNTIYGVTFDKKYGIQFTPVATGAIYNNANEECIRAAKMVLEGTSVNDGVLYFVNPRIASNSWVQNNRRFALAIGNHYFYY